jgi:hypothetical protein
VSFGSRHAILPTKINLPRDSALVGDRERGERIQGVAL